MPMAVRARSLYVSPDKPLPHPKYTEEYTLPKTKYGVKVRADQFYNNNFDYRGRDREDDGTRWWEAQWKLDYLAARLEQEKLESEGYSPPVPQTQRYIPTTREEEEAALWYQEKREHERKLKQRKIEAAERLAAEKEWWKQEDLKARLEKEVREQAVQDAVRAGKRSPIGAWWKCLMFK